VIENRVNTVPPVDRRLSATPTRTALASSLSAKTPSIMAIITPAAMPARRPIHAEPVAALASTPTRAAQSMEPSSAMFLMPACSVITAPSVTRRMGAVERTTMNQ
jgi:hypothetical protein